MPKIPRKVAIDHDDYHAEHIGKTQDGRQFFLTTPFTPNKEFIALYLFDKKGKFFWADITELGARHDINQAESQQIYAQKLADLGAISFERIEIAPFSVEKFGVTFGLLADEDEEGEISMIFEPGNYMAFYAPWDSGDYDT